MKTTRLDNSFFNQSALTVAPALLGKLLCRASNNKIIKARITETECYLGEGDSASHASRGKTDRNAIMFREGGYAYIYLCYGIHSLFNVVTGKEGSAEAVLIRGVEGAIGPGRLTKLLNLTRSQNGIDLRTSNELWLEDDGFVPSFKTSKRIGIDYALEVDKERQWRFFVDNTK